MTELFTLVNRPVAGQAQQTVNARELHAFLENRDMFANWIKDRIEQYGFVENQDFVRYLENSKKPLGGRPSMEYALSLDMAKELSMVERNQQQAAQIAELAPKAEALARIEVAQGDLTVTQAAKILNMQPKQLFDWLAQHGWLYRSGGSGAWLGYQDKVRSGCITHSVHRYESRSTGEQRIATQVYLTPKGMGKIAEKLGVAA